MSISKEEFRELYNAAFRDLTGRAASNASITRHYKYLRELCEISGSDTGKIIFGDEDFQTTIDSRGNLQWRYKPDYSTCEVC